MHGEFDHTMRVTGTDLLEVCGPINWDGIPPPAYTQPAARLDILAVFVFQPVPGAVAGVPGPIAGYTPGLSFTRTGPTTPAEWELDVPSLNGAIWTPGLVMAVACVRLLPSLRKDPPRPFYERWCQNITLLPSFLETPDEAMAEAPPVA